MPFDFTSRPDRSSDGSLKWEAMFEAKPDVAPDVVPLSVADMELPSAPAIVEAICSRARGHVLGYTGPTDAYFEAVLSWQRRRHGWDPRREWIALSPGVVPAFFAACQVLTRPGEGIIIQPPVYYPFRSAVEAAGRTLVENPLVEGEGLRYEIDFDDLERKAADPANTLLLLCSPHNPVGRVWTADELRRIVDICLANDVFIVSDEIHDDLLMPGFEHTTIMNVMEEGEQGRCMVCTAPSKTFNMAGIQCSNIFIPDPEVREAFGGFFDRQGNHGPTLNAFAYDVCIAAYTACDEWLDGLLSLVWENHRLLRERLADAETPIGVAPLEGTYLQWLDLRGWGKDIHELEALMVAHDLFLDEGYVFGTGGAGFERVNLACPTDVIEGAAERLLAAASEA
jgi:cystathionine beta-lyase